LRALFFWAIFFFVYKKILAIALIRRCQWTDHLKNVSFKVNCVSASIAILSSPSSDRLTLFLGFQMEKGDLSSKH
jgi:hypothetical protein